MTTTKMTKNEVMKTSEASINDGGPEVHPMVMKAARASSDTEAEIYGIDPNLKWEIGKERHIKTAKAALTECGALELLEALIHAHDNLCGGGADEGVVMEDFDIQIVEDAINSAGLEI